jgi:hypothetical protein
MPLLFQHGSPPGLVAGATYPGGLTIDAVGQMIGVVVSTKPLGLMRPALYLESLPRIKTRSAYRLITARLRHVPSKAIWLGTHPGNRPGLRCALVTRGHGDLRLFGTRFLRSHVVASGCAAGFSPYRAHLFGYHLVL